MQVPVLGADGVTFKLYSDEHRAFTTATALVALATDTGAGARA